MSRRARTSSRPVPVYCGVAAAAVFGGLTAAGVASTIEYVPLPPDTAADGAAAIGLAADGTTVIEATEEAPAAQAPTGGPAAQPRPVPPLAARATTSRPVVEAPAEATDSVAEPPAVLDPDMLAKAVRRANEEGKRLADDRDDRSDADESTAATPPQPSTSPPPQASAQSTAQPGTGRTASLPGELIDPDDWYLTLPTGKDGSPDTVDGAQLATYHSRFFDLTPERDGIVFTANAGGATTSGSHYPRSELREMNGGEKASWDGRTGTHTMVLDQAITATPAAKPDVIAGQIHGTSDDLMQIHLSGNQLTVKYADGKKKVVLDDDYRLGTRFTTKIEASGGHVKVWYNGEQKADLPINSSTSYFKAGAYVNSNTSKGEKASAEGQVVIYNATVDHTA